MAIKLFFAGDVVQSLGRKKPLLDDEMRGIVKEHDIACCNLEAPIRVEGQKKNEKIGPALCQDKQIIVQLRESEFNLITLANNHIMDYGVRSLDQTIQSITEQGLTYIGAGHDEKYKPFIFEKDGIRVGILNIAENGFGASLRDSVPGYAWYGAASFRSVLKELTESCNYTIIVCHGGAEKWKIPLPEYRDLYKGWIDEGVSIIIGHHPHIPQGWEKYKEGYIYYSLGNFAFDKGLGIQDPKTICVSICLDSTEIRADAILTECTENGVRRCYDKVFKKEMEERCRCLSSEDYFSEVNQKALESLEQQYIEYYAHIQNCFRGGPKQFLKTVYFKLIKHQSFSNLWLYHNICIETHYWICRRAIDLKINRREE